MSKQFEILVVCVGNVCRSPLAEHLLRARLQRTLGDGADAITVASAGTRAMAGYPMDAKAAHELALLGGEAHDFVARRLRRDHLDRADLVLTATRDLRSRVLEETPRALRRTFTIREFSALVHPVTGIVPWSAISGPRDLVAHAAQTRGSATLSDYDVPDPVDQSAAFHHDVAGLLDSECTRIAHALARAATGFPPRGEVAPVTMRSIAPLVPEQGGPTAAKAVPIPGQLRRSARWRR